MKAPTVVAKIRGYTLFDETAIRGYAALAIGDGIILTREPSNPVDKNAIICEIDCEKHGSHPIGYVDRDSASTLARWIDKGWIYTCSIVQEPCLEQVGFFVRLSPTPEALVKCVPLSPLTLKKKRKVHAPV